MFIRLRLARAQRLVAAILFFVVAAGAAPSAFAQDEQGRPITAEGALYLVRSTLIALSQANETGNYTVLRDLGAPGFRDANDAARLAAIFVSLRESGTDLSYAALTDPVFTGEPQLTNQNMLHLAGTVPGGTPDIAFEFLFQPVDGRWRLFGLAVNDAGAKDSPAPPEAADSGRDGADAGTAPSVAEEDR